MSTAAATATPRPDVLKRVFTSLTLGLPELAAIVACFEATGKSVTMRANTFKLWDISELRSVVAEEEVVDHLAISASAPGEGELRLHYDLGYILVEATEARFKAAFDRIAALLTAKTKNGTAHCLIVVDPNAELAAVKPSAEPSGRARVSDLLTAVVPLSDRLASITTAPSAASRGAHRRLRAWALLARWRLAGPTLTPARVAIACGMIGLMILLIRHGRAWAATMDRVSWWVFAASVACAGVAAVIGRSRSEMVH